MNSLNNNHINCLQINLQRSKSSTAQLNKVIEDQNFDIIFAQEPYVIRGKVCGFPLRYKVFHANCDTPKTAIIVTKPALQIISIETFAKAFSTIVYSQFNNKTFALISLYCSPLSDIDQELSHIQNSLNTLKPKNLIIAMDSNAHSRVWFNDRDDERGNILNDFIAQNNLLILNNNETIPSYHTTRGESFIDITLININSAPLVKDWAVLETESLSDHRYLKFTISDSSPNINFKSTIKYNTKKANWDSFLSEAQPFVQSLSAQLNDISTEVQMNHFIDRFNTKLTQICDKVLPKANSTKHSNTNSWWTQELTAMRSNVNRARRRYQRCQTDNRPRLATIYCQLKLEYKNKINQQKINSWNEFVETSTRNNPWGLVYKIAKKQLNFDKVNELVTLDGRLITDNKEIAETLLQNLFPNDNTVNDLQIHKQIRAEVEKDYIQDNDNSFTESEVTQVIEMQNENKSPGEDGFSADIVKHLHSIDTKFLTNLYNKCLLLGVFPQLWKSSIIKVIKKAGKTDYRQTSSYRPISLLSVFAKVLEKLLISRIMHYSRSNRLLNNKQYGFMPQKSTEDALHSMTKFIRNAFNKKGFALIIAIDIRGAFDHCWWPKILYQLRKKQCPKNLYMLSKSYFSKRKVKLWYQNTEVARDQTIGCPQGSASGPWFWNESFDDIFDIKTEAEEDIEGFADDTTLEVYAETIDELETRANHLLQKLNDWAHINKLDFNADKTTCVLFTNKLKYRVPELYLQNKKLKFSSSFKHLGVYLDSKLKFNIHANYVKSKASQLIMNLISIAKRSFGLNTKALEIIYKGAVLPIISYASSVWIDAVDKEYIRKPLVSMQRQIALRICKAYKTVSTEALNVISNLIPIDLYLKQTAMNYFIKHGINNEFTYQYLQEFNIDLQYVQKPFRTEDLPHFKHRKQANIVNQINDQIIAYTDGSKSTNGVGAGFCIIDGSAVIKTAKYKLSKYCSVFQAEMFAILNAVKHINAKLKSNTSITIRTDSQSAIKALQNASSTTVLVQEIYSQLRIAQQSQIHISFAWIRAHEGNIGNELADQLAKMGAVSHQSIAYDLMPVSYVKKIVYQKNLQMWNEKWTNANTGENTRQFLPTIYDRIRYKKLFTTDFYLTQFLTNHGKFNQYLNRFNIRSDPLCEVCIGKIDTALHVIFECERYEQQRRILIQHIESNNITWPCSPIALISAKVFEKFKQFCAQCFANVVT